MALDKARRKTDKMLKDIEGAISALYINSPKIDQAGQRYRRYMKEVSKLTEAVKKKYDTETDQEKKQKLKQDYIKQVQDLTINNSQYQRLIRDICYQIALVNQQALDIVNDSMAEIYRVNYNQVAVQCKRVGIEVIDNGDT